MAREQVRAQGINPMEFMARPLREAGRRGGVGPIVIPPYTPSSLIPSSLEFSSPRSSSSSRRRRGQGWGRGRGRRPPSWTPPGLGRQQRAGGAGGGSGGDDDGDDGGGNTSKNSCGYRRNQRGKELLRELQRLQQDNIEKSRGRQIAGVTHTNTITTTYKDGGTPTVSRTSIRVSN